MSEGRLSRNSMFWRSPNDENKLNTSAMVLRGKQPMTRTFAGGEEEGRTGRRRGTAAAGGGTRRRREEEFRRSGKRRGKQE